MMINHMGAETDRFPPLPKLVWALSSIIFSSFFPMQAIKAQHFDIARKYVATHRENIVNELVEFVSIPNEVSSVEQIRNNANHLKQLMEKRGIRTEFIPTPGGRPLVFGTLDSPGAKQTLLLYSHYDGVPAGEPEWHSAPYSPTLRIGAPTQLGKAGNWHPVSLNSQTIQSNSARLYGRSVADSKNAIISILTAIDAIKASGNTPGINFKFLFDGEEEMESPGLLEYLQKDPSKFQADLMISASGETHQSGLPTLAFGERGILILSIKTFTSVSAMHSGHFGNFAPNAALQLTQLLSSVKDRNGRVTIKGFYDEVTPLTAFEKAAISKIPRIEDDIKRTYGISRQEYPKLGLQSLINLPTFNVRGLKAGFVGSEARNIIPASAEAEVDVRLVKNMDPEKTLKAIKAHFRSQNWTILDHAPSRDELASLERIVTIEVKASFPAAKTPLDSPVAAKLIGNVKRAVGDSIVIEPTDGGSLPLYLFEKAGIPVVASPVSNSDCNQHTSDENLCLKHFFRGIEIFTSVMLWE